MNNMSHGIGKVINRLYHITHRNLGVIITDITAEVSGQGVQNNSLKMLIQKYLLWQ